MRLIYLTIPAVLAMACAGAALVVAAQHSGAAATVHDQNSIDIKDAEVRHLVSEEMIRETANWTRKAAPLMESVDTEGKKVALAPRDGAKPQFVYFVQDGCPCSFDAEPLFQKLYNHLGKKVDFLSVTDAVQKKAKEWSVQMLVDYPVVPDPEKRLIKAYEAKASVYSALISADGHIIKMWPGYSAGILKDMNKIMSQAANIKEKPFDPEYAPKEKATGCAF